MQSGRVQLGHFCEATCSDQIHLGVSHLAPYTTLSTLIDRHYHRHRLPERLDLQLLAPMRSVQQVCGRDPIPRTAAALNTPREVHHADGCCRLRMVD